MTDPIVQDDSTTTPSVADDWEHDDGAEDVMQKQLEEKLKKVRILQREKADKTAMMERAKQAEPQESSVPEASAPIVPFQPPLKMQILQRPREVEDPNKLADAKDTKVKTLEERQAAYDEARSRILGANYNAEPAVIPVTISAPTSTRNKSPEQIRVHRPSPDYLICMQPSMPSNASAPALYSNYMHAMSLSHQVQPYQMHPQAYVPYIDTSRPPPQAQPQVQMASSTGMQHQGGHYASIPSIAHYHPTGQYYTAMPTPVPQPVPFGAPPVALYPPGTLGSVLQFNAAASGQTQAQRKNKNKKKPGSVAQPAQQTA